MKTHLLALLLPAFLLNACGKGARKAQPPEEGFTPIPLYVAQGNEPYWSLKIYEGNIVWHLLGEEPQTYPYFEPRLVGEKLIFQTRGAVNGQTSTLKVELTEAPCTDTMKGEAFPMQAVVMRDGKRYEGCAR